MLHQLDWRRRRTTSRRSTLETRDSTSCFLREQCQGAERNKVKLKDSCILDEHVHARKSSKEADIIELPRSRWLPYHKFEIYALSSADVGFHNFISCLEDIFMPYFRGREEDIYANSVLPLTSKSLRPRFAIQKRCCNRQPRLRVSCQLCDRECNISKMMRI